MTAAERQQNYRARQRCVFVSYSRFCLDLPGRLAEIERLLDSDVPRARQKCAALRDYTREFLNRIEALATLEPGDHHVTKTLRHKIKDITPSSRAK